MRNISFLFIYFREEQDDIIEGGEESLKPGKKGKKSRKKDFDEDDIARELQELSLEVNGELPESTKSVEVLISFYD